MGFLGMFGLKKAPSAKQIRDMLPALHSFVDVQVRNGPKGSVCFENSGAGTFATSVLPGMLAGQVVNFFYQTSAGKFRFSTSVKAVDAKQATFEIPGKIETLQKFGGAKKRTNVRIDTTITSQWRYSSTGKIESEWQKGVLSDISRTGSSLATDKVVKSGTVLELKIPLTADGSHDQPSGGGEARRQDREYGEAQRRLGVSSAFEPRPTARSSSSSTAGKSTCATAA